MTAAEIVRATGVTKGFAAAGGRGRTEAVRGVNFTVGQGELVVLLGRSGAGKSTLLSLVGGIDSPDAGTIVVAGQDVGGLHGRSREEYLRRTVGWMFQSAGLLPLLSAQENVWLAARLLGHRDSAARKAALEALEAVGLASRAGHRAAELSGGEQLRVALARALVKTPVLLLADEPTAQLDSETGKSVLDVIRAATGSGTSILLATHDKAVVEIADRVLLMEDGRLAENAGAPTTP
ncbi:MAG TPA: ABC transporter ATP-binding protein [Candidatus Nitrosotalea sp.]|nr:ABC transporter ATP-binding protein [Candidatus Nitrosotalea sp.]